MQAQGKRAERARPRGKLTASVSDGSVQYAAAEGVTTHRLHLGDARELDWIPDESVHLVLTSPPYWTLKRYEDDPGQLGHVED